MRALAERNAMTVYLNNVCSRFSEEGFKGFMEGLTKQMGQPFSIVSELLLLCGLEMQPLSKSDSALVKEIQVVL